MIMHCVKSTKLLYVRSDKYLDGDCLWLGKPSQYETTRGILKVLQVDMLD